MNTRTPILAALLAAGAAAQNPTPEEALQRLDARRAWLVPIHTSTVADATETWAGGLDFKARFDRGVSFFPVLGKQAPRNLPLRWRTESIRFDGAEPFELAHDAADALQTDWRYELRYGTATEVYDVHEDGVAQSFVVRERIGLGDLVVVGRIDTELTAPEREAEHGELVFGNSDGAVLSYGAAFALDAAGRELPLATAFDGERVELRVPASWLEEAAWPVTIDPLLARKTVDSAGVTAGASENPSLIFDGHNNQYCLAYARAVSASDRDTYVRILDANLDHFALINGVLFTVDSPICDVCYVSASDRYVFAIDFRNDTNSWVALYVHDADDYGPVSYVTNVVSPPGTHDSDPSIGGASDGSRAYLALRRDTALSNTGDSIVVGMTFDPGPHGFGAVTEIRSSNALFDYDAEAPSVTKWSENGSGWFVAWQEINDLIADDDWDIYGRRVGPTGSLSSAATFGDGATSTLHKFRPAVAGSDGEYGVAFLVRQNPNTPSLGNGFGRWLELETFMWASTAYSSPLRDETTTVDFYPIYTLDLGTGHALDFDRETDSHWTIAWRRDNQDRILAERLGYDLKTVESVEVEDAFSGTYFAPVVAHNTVQNRSVIAYGQQIPFSGNPISMRALTVAHAPASMQAPGCAGTISIDNRGSRDLPYPGSEHFRISLDGGVPSVPTWLLASGVPGNFVLPLLPGCPLYFDVTQPIMQIAYGFSSAGGNALVYLPLPSTTSVTLYFQWVQVNVFEVYTSDMWQLSIGD